MRVSFYYTLLVLLFAGTSKAQEVQTIFKGQGMSHGGYGVITNKFTTIDGEFANMVEVYGGWFINHKLLLGVGGGATTSYLPVPESHSMFPGEKVSYEYGQFGFVTEYVIASNKSVHVAFHVLTGAGFTLQYVRYPWYEYDYYPYHNWDHDENWFFVVEPGIQVELNLLKWMRFSPGLSYRFVNNSQSDYLTDDKLSGASFSLSMKFGKF